MLLSCQMLSGNLRVMMISMWLWSPSGVMMSQVISRSNTTNTSICTWQTPVSPVDYCSRNILFGLYPRHPMQHHQSSSRHSRNKSSQCLITYLNFTSNLTCRLLVSATQVDPIRCYNADTKRTCRVILRVPSLPADNPQQSEEASHMGGNANHGCRKCKAGGNHEHTESDEGYHSLHFVSMPISFTVIEGTNFHIAWHCSKCSRNTEDS